MAFDYSKLIGRIIEKYGTRSNFAKKYGISMNSLSSKLNNHTRFTADDIIKISSKNFLDIPDMELKDYFFTEKVEKNRTNK